jgi:predicted Zn finger-like uncharacterized protein
MRLICPNCDAEYEVDDAAIPDGGRDVQCSNCGHAWFQLPAEVEAAMDEEEALFGAVPAAAVAAPQGPEPAAPPRRPLDESLMAVLREEAEREAAARRAEGTTAIEMQTEMPLSPPEGGSGLAAAAARRIAKLKGIPVDPAPAAAPPVEAEAEAVAAATAAKGTSRRGLLPDIEEINSSLRAGGAEGDDAGRDEPATRSGFRSGFVLAMLLAAVGAGAYAMAPQIGAELPAAKGALESYVHLVDAGRLWLDGAMRQATAVIRDLTKGG